MAADSPEFIDPAEDCPCRSRREIFAHSGYAPLPPSELDAACATIRRTKHPTVAAG